MGDVSPDLVAQSADGQPTERSFGAGVKASGAGACGRREPLRGAPSPNWSFGYPDRPESARTASDRRGCLQTRRWILQPPVTLQQPASGCGADSQLFGNLSSSPALRRVASTGRDVHDYRYHVDVSLLAGLLQPCNRPFAQPDALLLRNRRQDAQDRVFEEPAGIQVLLGERAVAHAVMRQQRGCKWLSVSSTPSRLNRSSDQNNTRSSFRCEASLKSRWNCSRSECFPVARSIYSWTTVQPCVAAKARSWESWFSGS